MSLDFQQIQALAKLYPSVVRTVGNIAYDIEGMEVSYDPQLIQDYLDANAYKAKRASEYPPITDYLDGIVKGDQAQIDKYIADCQTVKAKYPKAG